ncbi:hypothetical protein L6452_06416 [Arctium lappa]|uniref:Uncharacterized protein n=1 Tax=Arctium lappa TaxID=4217 RepID=A0ACB9EIM5_ARCLA|nr:hypothetical protein L6452_06416 [Arctium lappa]
MYSSHEAEPRTSDSETNSRKDKGHERPHIATTDCRAQVPPSGNVIVCIEAKQASADTCHRASPALSIEQTETLNRNSQKSDHETPAT